MANKWLKNWQKTRKQVGWIEIKKAKFADYQKIGFKSGLEVHQQLDTKKKLFCRCPSGIYHDFDDYDAEIIRHMRPTLSELGEYDGTALMEFKTKKNIVYRINNDTACTYEVDDTPPFALNREALDYAMQIALLLKMNIVGELHITRKQYLDGSIPTGFQRTTILGIEGEIPISTRKIRLIQFSIEEDSCREFSDYRHTRIYHTDRLGIPLVETVTYPDMLTPSEAAEACQHIRFVMRSSGRVRKGIGAARQDVNVSVRGGTRVEIKGVSHISWIPKLTHNEGFRQVSLLMIRDELNKRINDTKVWRIKKAILPEHQWQHIHLMKEKLDEDWRLVAVNLPDFKNILSFFTQPERTFADEISDRLKVIPCLEKPNMFCSEDLHPTLSESDWEKVRLSLQPGENDAQILFWTPEEDLATALETIEERCKLAFEGVPNETRKSIPDGTTIFERVLPGADRMYPDTDSKPISISQGLIEEAGKNLPVSIAERLAQLAEWKVPIDAYVYILRNNLMPIIEKIVKDLELNPKTVALFFAHRVKNLQKNENPVFDYNKIYDFLKFVKDRKLEFDIAYEMLPVLFENPNIMFNSILDLIDYEETKPENILKEIPSLHSLYREVGKSKNQPYSELNWIMGKLRKDAVGNMPLRELRKHVFNYVTREAGNA